MYPAVEVRTGRFVALRGERGGATFGPLGLEDPHRYHLARFLTDRARADAASSHLRIVAFILLNPSKATHEQSDPTVEKCVRYGRRWGYDVVVLGNIFALRATDPKELKRAAEQWEYGRGPHPAGPENDAVLCHIADEADLIVCGWGQYGALMGRGEYVGAMLRRAGHELHYLRLSKKTGQPYHPLYLRDDTEPVLWR